ncbi:MAG: hypothetical protein Q8Q00_02980 [Dehalococcoidia bacterium]|nr:hypothetical protein [Dehalococcoidia bacterium]
MLTVVLAVACGGGRGGGGGDDRATPTPGAALTRSAEAGGITVEGTWLTEPELDGLDADLTAYPLDEFVLVEIAFTTHSGDLNKVDMEQAATLSGDGEDIRPEAWISLSDDSHHREGVLVFERTEAEGPVELTVELGDDEEVALTWESPPTT